MAILQVSGRNEADPGHDMAGDIGIEVLIEHPDNLAAPPTGAIKFMPAARGGAAMGHERSCKSIRLRHLLPARG
jgi:hypothetical protein